MEFHENKAKAPFIGFVQLWQAVRSWWRQIQNRRGLQQMSDERLRILGYAGGCGVMGQFPFPYGEGEKQRGVLLLITPIKSCTCALFTRRQLGAVTASVRSLRRRVVGR